MSCSGGAPPPRMDGGRRRRTRKMKGGNFYGMGEPIAVGVPTWNAVENVAANHVTGAPIVDGSEMNAVKVTGGRRRRTRKSKKATRKGGKHRKGHRRSRKMRGGASWVTSAPAGGSFTGQGAGGLASLTQYSGRMPVAGGPPQNQDGAYRV